MSLQMVVTAEMATALEHAAVALTWPRRSRSDHGRIWVCEKTREKY